MARVNLSHYKVLELPAEPQPDAIYYILDEDNEVALWYVTTSEGVAIPASDAAAVETLVNAAVEASKAWTVVSSSAASVSPTAADSGKHYRLSHVSPTFNLPTTGLVIGKTEFWLTFTGSVGQVDAGSGKEVTFLANDVGALYGYTNQFASEIHSNRLYHLRYSATNVWDSDLIMTV